MKGYSGWSRHLWIGQIEQVSFSGEAGYHIPEAVVLCLANLFLAIYRWPSWKALLLIQKLSVPINLPCRFGSKPVHLRRGSEKDHFSGLQTAYLKDRWEKPTRVWMAAILDI